MFRICLREKIGMLYMHGLNEVSIVDVIIKISIYTIIS